MRLKASSGVRPMGKKKGDLPLTAFEMDEYVRIMPSEHDDTPLGMGPGASRFSSPSGQYNVLYAASDVRTATAETLIRDRFVDGDERLIAQDDVTSKSIVRVSSKESANLVDLRKPNSLTYGIDTDVSCARAHDAGQEFSERVYNTSEEIDGILYESRFTGELCAVIFDRAVERCLDAGKCTPLTDEPELEGALEEFNVELIPADDDGVDWEDEEDEEDEWDDDLEE